MKSDNNQQISIENSFEINGNMNEILKNMIINGSINEDNK